MDLFGDSRGQMSTGNAKLAVSLIIALVVASLLAAFLLPIGINAMADDTSQTNTLNETESATLEGTYSVTLDSVDDTNSQVNVTVSESETGDSATIQNLDVGTNETVTVDGSDITVTADSVDSATSATLTSEYPKNLGWGDGAQSLWNILPMILVLAMFLFFVGVALSASGRL